MKVIVINSAKGGVGKTRTSVGLASALVRQGKTVSIWDLDVTTPNVGSIPGVPVFTSDIRTMPNKTSIKKFIKRSYAGTSTEYVVVDTPPTISEMYLSIASFLGNAEFFFVTTRAENSVRDTGKGMRFFAIHGIDVTKVIVNLSDTFDGYSDDEVQTVLDCEIVDRINMHGHLDNLAKYVLNSNIEEFKMRTISSDAIVSRLSGLTREEALLDMHIPPRFYNLETWDIMKERLLRSEIFGSSSSPFNVDISQIKPFVAHDEGDLVYVRILRAVSTDEKFLPYEIVRCRIETRNKVSLGLPMAVTVQGTHLWIGEVVIVSDMEVALVIEAGGIDIGDSVILDFFNQIYMYKTFNRSSPNEELMVIELHEKKTGISVSNKDKIFTQALLLGDTKVEDYDIFMPEQYVDSQTDYEYKKFLMSCL